MHDLIEVNEEGVIDPKSDDPETIDIPGLNRRIHNGDSVDVSMISVSFVLPMKPFLQDR